MAVLPFAHHWMGNWGRPEGQPTAPPSADSKDPVGHPTSELESRLCECGHTYYMHGDRAIALCGGAEKGTREPDAPIWTLGLQCQCKGFTEAL